MPLDETFLQINEFARRTPALHAPAHLYATWGIVLFALLIALGLGAGIRNRDQRRTAAALLTAAGTLVAYAVQQLVVFAVAEPRPYAVHPSALLLVEPTTDPSFPSDHSCLTGAIAAGLFTVDRRLGWTAAALAVLMAATRVYVGAHWPLDVVAGLVLGALLCGACVRLTLGAATSLLGRHGFGPAV